MREITCCFTGHRKISADKIPFVRRNLREAIYAACTEGYRRFVCGGALGFDTMAAIEVLSFKKMFFGNMGTNDFFCTQTNTIFASIQII